MTPAQFAAIINGLTAILILLGVITIGVLVLVCAKY